MRIRKRYTHVFTFAAVICVALAQPCPPSWEDENDPACECDLSCTLGREVGPDRLCPYGHHIEWVDSTCAPCANASEVERCVACPPGVYENTTACGCDASCVRGYHPGPDRLCPYNHHIEWVDSTCAPCTGAILLIGNREVRAVPPWEVVPHWGHHVRLCCHWGQRGHRVRPEHLPPMRRVPPMLPAASHSSADRGPPQQTRAARL